MLHNKLLGYCALAALIVGLSCAVITLLFLVQQFGTGAIGYLFSPVLFTWCLFICGAPPRAPAATHKMALHAIH
jgi:K+ transporter